MAVIGSNHLDQKVVTSHERVGSSFGLERNLDLGSVKAGERQHDSLRLVGHVTRVSGAHESAAFV